MNAEEFLKKYRTENENGLISYESIIKLMESYAEFQLKEKHEEMKLMYWYFCNSETTGTFSEHQSEKLGEVDLLMEKYEQQINEV